ncbi:GSCOCG00007418001-RA-CDS [Cotesia congregata]|uniref:Uncharacterized protein n=1 Tax=Cotesia congregata TaxID=51543 RepID=A0A8J2HCG5_COTCN|nr:GSCOCG00007418001-RA-CDS [Cotesia congregata]CAG5088666.1 Protein of unknown function [Cotesia congregata]
MKRLLLVFLVMTFALTVHAHVIKRDESEEEEDKDDDDGEEEEGLKGLMLKSKTMSMKVPLVGELTGDTIGKLIDGYEALQLLTDGAVGRLLGGAFPCTVSLDSFACTGHTAGKDLAYIIEKLLNPIPWVFFPDLAKNFVVLMIQVFVEPMIDVLLGGIAKPEAIQA